MRAEDLGERLAQVPEARRRDEMINYLVDLKLGAKAAADAKIGDGPDFTARLAYLPRQGSARGIHQPRSQEAGDAGGGPQAL